MGLIEKWDADIATSLKTNVYSDQFKPPTIENDPLIKEAIKNSDMVKALDLAKNIYSDDFHKMPTENNPIVKEARRNSDMTTAMARGNTPYSETIHPTDPEKSPLVIDARKNSDMQEALALAALERVEYPSEPSMKEPLVSAMYEQNSQTGESIQDTLSRQPYTAANRYQNTNPTRRSLLFREGLLPEVIRDDENIDFGHNEYTPAKPFAPIAATSPALNAGDIFAVAHFYRNLGREFGVIGRHRKERIDGRDIAKGITFLATQFLLTSFNPSDPQHGGILNLVYNPASLPATAFPGVRGNAWSSPNLPAFLSGDGKVYSTAQGALGSAGDRLLLMREGLYKKGPSAADLLEGRLGNQVGWYGNLAGPGPTEQLGSMHVPGLTGVSIEGQVDQAGIMGAAALDGDYHTNLYTANNPYVAQNAPIDLDWLEAMMRGDPKLTAEQLQLQALFKSNGGVQAALSSLVPFIKKPAQYEWYFKRTKKGATALPASYPSSVDVAFPGETNGLISEADAIEDNVNYMPFSFQDLRESSPKIMYMRAFLKEGSLRETFAPRWQTEAYYGRVDEVPTYVNTVRTIQFAFDVVAWTPQDLEVMWIKLTKLQSMVYPEYGTDHYLRSGPLVRIRLGDLICSGRAGLGTVKRGLPGYITSLDFAYDDDIWNIAEDYKVPRKVSVSLGFTVIHDGNPGIYQQEGGGAIFGALEYADDPTAAPTVRKGNIRGILQTVDPEPNSTVGGIPDVGVPDVGVV